MDAALIELAGIERVFHLGDSEVHALRRLELRITAGEYLAVMGLFCHGNFQCQRWARV